MSLRGSLDTFALPDVLTLLATTAKSGELHVKGLSGDGRVWLDGGQVTAAEGPGTTDVVDVLVALLRLEEGDFSFAADEVADDPGTPLDVAALLEQAEGRLAEWREVERVIPSADVLVYLVAPAPGAVRLTKDQWNAVVAVGEGHTVAELVDVLGGDELTQWRLLAGLVEAGLAEVGEAQRVAPVSRTELAEQLSTLNVAALAEAPPDSKTDRWFVSDDEDEQPDEELDSEPEEDDVPAVAAATPVAAESADPADGVSRGTLLKFLSSVRS